MANTRFGNFSSLSQGKKPMDAQEAWLMLKQLGLLGQEFVPGATSIRKIMEGKPMEAVDELVDWIPEGRAVQKFADNEEQDWAKNALDAMIIGKPITKGAKKAFEAIERIPKGGKEGFIKLNYKEVMDDLDNYPELVRKANPNFTKKDAEDLQDLVTLSYNVKKGKISNSYFQNKLEQASDDVKEAYGGLYTLQEMKYGREGMPVPENWNSMSDIEKLKYYEKNYIPKDLNPNIAFDRVKKANRTVYNGPDKGITFDDVLTPEGYAELRMQNPDYNPMVKEAKVKEIDTKKAEEKARKEAEKEARWRAEREAAAKKAEEARLAKEAEARRLAEEQAEAERVAREEAEAAERAEAERKAQEEEFERQFREEEASERNRYADSVGTALGMEAVNKDIDDWLLERMIEDEENQRLNRPIEMLQVEDFGDGILHNEGPAAVPQGGRRNTYDHSRQFMDTELKQVPPIDRTGMTYGDDADAMYDIYKAWRDSKPNDRINQVFGYDMAGTNAIRRLKEEARRGKDQSNAMIIATDPYYAAGVVGDSNVRLWNKIDALKAEGKTDKEIREILKDDLNKYQGQIERFKERMPSKGHGSQFDYDGAITQTLKALPSEEARALKALGIDIPEYDELERLGNFYRVFFPK